MDVGVALARAERMMRLGFNQGVERGRETGREEGRLEMAREALMIVLAARRLTASTTDRAKIETEESPQRLETWLRRATVCRSVVEVLG